ncbi:MAG: hypothetical protein ABI337_05390 [Nitrososphaera sp.]|jgi:hypothetical protein
MKVDDRVVILITRNYFIIGIILLMIGGAVSAWGIVSYFDLKKAEKEYRELPQNSPPGSNEPYPTDDFFWQRNGMITVLFTAGAVFLLKWKIIK